MAQKIPSYKLRRWHLSWFLYDQHTMKMYGKCSCSLVLVSGEWPHPRPGRLWVYVGISAGPDPTERQIFASVGIRTPVPLSSLCSTRIDSVLTGQVIQWKVSNYLNVWPNITILYAIVSNLVLRNTHGSIKGCQGCCQTQIVMAEEI
jgi:hypothetical protein